MKNRTNRDVAHERFLHSIPRFVFHRGRAFRRYCVFLLLIMLALVQARQAQGKRDPVQTAIPDADAGPGVIVIGFVGGFIKHDNLAHSEVQLAARLRKVYPKGVDVETFESYHEERALKRVLRRLDTNHDGALSPEEKKNARIIIYGHSWGGSETIILARGLNKLDIPVLLTIQVDSVTKIHQNDAIIPPNVAKAANLYQANGRMHGQSKIHAADPMRTKIIGNFKFDYKGSPYRCEGYPWYDRVFGKAHTQIECDPKVWEQVEALIGAEIGPDAAPVSTP